MEYPYSREELYFLMVHDSDGFNRWNAAQLLSLDIMNELQQSVAFDMPPLLIKAFEGVLANSFEEEVDKAMLAHLLALPTEGILIEQAVVADVDAIHLVRERIANQLASTLKDSFVKVYTANCTDQPYKADAGSIAKRALKNMVLAYLVRTGEEKWLTTCFNQFSQAENMTDQMAALRCLVNSDTVKPPSPRI
jgi:aminopeptidase N